MDVQVPRGTHDILPQDVEKWNFVENIFRNLCYYYGYKEIRTPVFEHTEIFTRGIGETTDIVDKEMYTFPDKKGRSLTLRPEWTAPVMRSVIENKLPVSPPLKLFYIGPIFRYERPMQGRYRQAHQLGVELIGGTSPLLDVEVIDLIINFYNSLGLKGLSVTLNSIGCSECRPVYREKLIQFCQSHIEDLCGNCKDRFNRNPLRILDCKNPKCADIAKKSPVIIDNICGECKEHFNTVIEYLNDFNISYNICNNLVRGLDYYTRTVFEVISTSLGTQNSLCGGGRYDNLMEILGGKPSPGIGFAAGIERAIMVMEKETVPFPIKPEIDILAIPLGETCRKEAFKIVRNMRHEGFASVDLTISKKGLKEQLKIASKMGSLHTIIIGDRELEAGEVVIRDMKENQQINVKIDGIIDYFKKLK